MSKIMGIIMSIAGFLITIFTYFLYRNSSSYLAYLPEEKLKPMSAVGLTLPMIIGVMIFIAGVSFLLLAKEDNSEMKN
jgi:UDP-N-acetylmuramyl pentapeptide phosphotransferase/UDP-N-acetylglucosamine-1-phosphate transferase